MSPPERKRATAMSYRQGSGDGAPKIVAQGQGLIADKILELARAAGVPIREDAALANALESLEIGMEIPEDLYVAVAEALAWAYKLDKASRPRLNTA
jgi:flagellar biosynthesis protein